MTDTLTIYKGIRGANGKDGINGLGPTDVNSVDIDNPILDSLQPNNLSKNAFVTWARNQLATYVNRYGQNSYSEQESYTNYADYSENFSQWNDLLGSWSIVGNIADPLGNNDATEINLDVDTDSLVGLGPVVSRNENGWATGGYVVVSFYVRLISGTVSSIDIGAGSDVYTLGQLSNDWVRKSVKVSASSGGFNLSINPRGLTGARVGLFGVQIDETLLNPYIKTNGTNRTVSYSVTAIQRQNDLGYLIEDQKQNLCRNTQDFNDWTITNGTVAPYEQPDSFGFTFSKIRLVYSSISTINLTTETEALIDGTEYTVSFYAFVSGGSLTSISVSLAGGESVTFGQPSTTGFSRLSAKVTAGSEGSGISVDCVSEALNAQLHIHAFQIEEGELSSYSESSTSGQIRELDLVSMDYEYNAPAPNLPWSFFCQQNSIPNDTRVKTIFSNGESGANEFSLTVSGSIYTLNNGGNTQGVNLSEYRKIGITYDGATVRFYGEQREVFSATMGSTSFIATNMYLGSNGVDDALNAYLSKCLFYNITVPSNDIEYLLGE